MESFGAYLNVICYFGHPVNAGINFYHQNETAERVLCVENCIALGLETIYNICREASQS